MVRTGSVPVVVLVALAVALGGCIGSSGDDVAPDTAGTDDAPSGDPVPMARRPPTWQVGDFWTYQLTGDGIEDREATLVVADATGDGYVVETDDRETAFFDERFDISYMGPQTSDLAGSQGDTDVRFFQWPLEGNASWTTTWDGVERNVTVTDRTVRDGAAVVELTARDPEGQVDVEYTYDARVGWFGEIRFLDDGTETFALELQDDGASFSGTYVTVDLTEVENENFTGSFQGSGEVAEVTEDHDDFWVSVAWQADDPGSVGYGYSGPEGEGGNWGETPCPCSYDSVQTTIDDPATGNWTWSGGTILTEGNGYVDATVYLRDFVEHEVEADAA